MSSTERQPGERNNRRSFLGQSNVDAADREVAANQGTLCLKTKQRTPRTGTFRWASESSSRSTSTWCWTPPTSLVQSRRPTRSFLVIWLIKPPSTRSRGRAGSASRPSRRRRLGRLPGGRCWPCCPARVGHAGVSGTDRLQLPDAQRGVLLLVLRLPALGVEPVSRVSRRVLSNLSPFG